MKYILMAFQPKWLALIMNGKKKVEVRTRIPECLKNGEPVTVLGYCAKSTGGRIAMNKPYLFMSSTDKNFLKQCGADIYCLSTLRPIRNVLNGLVCCKFVVEKASEIVLTADTVGGYLLVDLKNPMDEFKGGLMTNAECCLSHDELVDYCKGKSPKALPITDLVVFKKPKELSEFNHWNPKKWNGDTHWFPVTRAPQSWMYIAEPVGVEL